MWEEFRSLALPLLGKHFPPELVKDNGDSLVFIDRRSLASFFVTENARGLTIGYYGERNTIETFCSTPSHELATVCLKLLARDGMDDFVDITYTPRELLGPVPDAVFSISKDHLPFSSSPRLSIPRYPRHANHSHALELSPRPTAYSTHKRRLLNNGARRRPWKDHHHARTAQRPHRTPFAWLIDQDTGVQPGVVFHG